MNVTARLKIKSLRNRTLLWAFIFILPILLLFLYSTNKATRSYEEQMQSNLQQILAPYAREIDVTLDNTRRFIANRRLDLSVLDATVGDELTALNAMRLLGDSFSEDLLVHALIDAMFLYHDDQMWFVQNYNRSYLRQHNAAEYLRSFLQTHDNTSPIFRDGYLSFEANGEYFLFIAIELADSTTIGCWFSANTLLEEINTSEIEGLSYAMFADRNGRMLDERFNTRSTRQLAELLSGYLVVTEQLTSGAFTLTALLDRNVVFAPFLQLNRVILLALGAAFVLFLIYISFVRGSVIMPLTRLIASIQRIQIGDFSPIPHRDSDPTEIQEVYSALNTMTNEVEALKIRVYEEELMKQDTQMQLFHLQLRPHFFLNALNTILSFARANEYALLQKMTLGLATHCRYILYNTGFVSVEEELAYTQNYVNMQGIQHNTRYRYVADAGDEVLDQEIPILVIQIFVENALKHSREQKDKVDIFTSVKPIAQDGCAYLRITIDDWGIGFGDDMLVTLNSHDAVMPMASDHGIGIENVRRRLEILYGDQATIAFSNNSDGGAHVEMLLPSERRKQ